MVSIEIGQPVERGALVMHAAPAPFLFDLEQWCGHGAIRRYPPLKLPAVDDRRAAEHHGRRRADVALPDAAIIELNAHAIGRIDSALAARINPSVEHLLAWLRSLC